MEEAALLIAMQRVVGGVEVEHDLLRRAAMGLQKKATSSASIIDGSWLILW